jgi:hypothetical protein
MSSISFTPYSELRLAIIHQSMLEFSNFYNLENMNINNFHPFYFGEFGGEIPSPALLFLRVGSGERPLAILLSVAY